MKVVVDTNVVVSGAFFGGKPWRIIETIISGKLTAYATAEIIEEYNQIFDEMISRKQGRASKDLWVSFLSKLHVIDTNSIVRVCRDPDDDKFISCALDAGSVFVISGDKDLLDLERYEGVLIITAAEFCNMYL